jgi:pilus assembly protein CpaF
MSSLERILPFLSPIKDLLLDPAITEVMVNAGGRQVFVERAGVLEHRPGRKVDERHLAVAIKNIARTCGDEVSEEDPILDARLEDGSRVAALLPPCSVNGPTLTIRRFTRRYTLEDLVAIDSVSVEAAGLLRAAVARRQNLLISGGTGTGKTTLLNALVALIPDTDRIALLEETSEILIDKPNHLRFEARRARTPLGSSLGVAAVTIADLLRATLRHRPDRIIVGEVRGAEAFDLLQALNTGHLGSMTTIHANDAGQALTRLAHCVVSGPVGLPHAAIREAIALAVHLVVHIARDAAQRRVTEVIRVRRYDAQQDRFVVEHLYTRGNGVSGR